MIVEAMFIGNGYDFLYASMFNESNGIIINSCVIIKGYLFKIVSIIEYMRAY